MSTGQWNRWWLENPDGPENYVYVLDAADNQSLETIGTVGPLAQGEQIWSARFIEDKAYLVTFRNIDPLWTIDLSDPENPRVMGELEVPGVSTYIHPLEDNFLLTIGYGGDESGLDWSMQVSLFDVSDFDNATLVDSLPLAPPEAGGWESWASSEALREHKAFQYWEQRKLLAVPLSTYRYYSEEGPNYYYYYYEYLAQLQLISVDTGAGLSLYGSVDHSPFYNDNATYYWCGMDVRRSIFMGDYIYALSDKGVTANLLDTMAPSAAITLPGSDCGYFYIDDVAE
ncbi:beta-propeller domain-containing protein [Thermodesulfobacteriota bacterium]